jgi:DNA-binding MarR family transcriptional regulator
MVGRLLAELKQQAPFRNRAVEAYLNILRTADLLRREMTAKLRPYQLSLAQFNVLRILRGARGQAISCGDISSRLVVYEPDLTRLLDRLVAQGRVERERDPADRRKVRSRITPAGLDLLTALDHHIDMVNLHRLHRLSDAQLTQLIDCLEAVRHD